MKYLFALCCVAFLAFALIQYGATGPTKPAKFCLDACGVKELALQGKPLEKFVPASVAASLELRDKFLEDGTTESLAVSVQRLSSSFGTVYRELFPRGSDTPSLFDFSGIDFETAIRGLKDCPTASDCYGSFTGKWYGRWEQRDVDHQWSRVVEPGELAFATELPEFQVGWQYAWIGDGYGINQCLSFEEKGQTKRFLLGYTEHLEGGDFGKVVAKRPHVGIFAGDGKLIWITAHEVFFEQSHEGDDSKYSIIGFRYRTEADQLAVMDGFVTEYSENVENRTPFRDFKCSCTTKRLAR